MRGLMLIWVVSLAQWSFAQSFFSSNQLTMRSSVVHESSDPTATVSTTNPANLIRHSGLIGMMRIQQRFGLKELSDVDAMVSIQRKNWGGMRFGWMHQGTGNTASDQCLLQLHHWVGERASIGVGIRGHRMAFTRSSSMWTGAVEIGMVCNIAPHTMLGWQFATAQQSPTDFRWQDPSIWEFRGALGNAWTPDFWTSIQWEKQPGKPLRLRVETRYSPTSAIQFQTGIGADWSTWLGMHFIQTKNSWLFQGMKHPNLGWSVSMSWFHLKMNNNE
jgi:hypothetical protein